jgi:hypothetical protein
MLPPADRVRVEQAVSARIPRYGQAQARQHWVSAMSTSRLDKIVRTMSRTAATRRARRRSVSSWNSRYLDTLWRNIQDYRLT